MKEYFVEILCGPQGFNQIVSAPTGQAAMDQVVSELIIMGAFTGYDMAEIKIRFHRVQGVAG